MVVVFDVEEKLVAKNSIVIQLICEALTEMQQCILGYRDPLLPMVYSNSKMLSFEAWMLSDDNSP